MSDTTPTIEASRGAADDVPGGARSRRVRRAAGLLVVIMVVALVATVVRPGGGVDGRIHEHMNGVVGGDGTAFLLDVDALVDSGFDVAQVDGEELGLGIALGGGVLPPPFNDTIQLGRDVDWRTILGYDVADVHGGVWAFPGGVMVIALRDAQEVLDRVEASSVWQPDPDESGTYVYHADRATELADDQIEERLFTQLDGARFTPADGLVMRNISAEDGVDNTIGDDLGGLDTALAWVRSDVVSGSAEVQDLSPAQAHAVLLTATDGHLGVTLVSWYADAEEAGANVEAARTNLDAIDGLSGIVEVRDTAIVVALEDRRRGDGTDPSETWRVEVMATPSSPSALTAVLGSGP